MNGWELVENGSYVDAIGVFTEQLQTRPSTLDFNNRGMAYLHLGNYDAALADFRSAEAVSSATLQTVCDGSMCGVASWMAAREQEALDTWLAGVDASLAGLVRYGDAAGGVTVGNLLFFAGVRMSDKNAVAAATRLLRKRLRTKQSIAWPGPTSRHLLGQASETEMLAAVSDVAFLRERQLCQARFYAGVRALTPREPAAYLEAMREAYEFGRVTKLEPEYYLAAHEARTYTRAEQGAAADGGA